MARAPRLHRGGRGFESLITHQEFQMFYTNKILKLSRPILLAVVAALIVVGLLIAVLIRNNREQSSNKASTTTFIDANGGTYQQSALQNEDGKIPQTASDLPQTSSNGPQPCSGNKDDVCIFAPSVDFWPSQGEDSTNHDYAAPANSVIKNIGGVMTAYSGTNITLKTASGRSVVVTFPLEVVDWWNMVHSPNYNNYRVGVGDTMTIEYGEPADQHSDAIGPKQILATRFAIKPVETKAELSEPIQRY